MKVELTVKEAAYLEQVARALSEPSEHDSPEQRTERQEFDSASRKLRGALERSGARIDGQSWTVRLKRPGR